MGGKRAGMIQQQKQIHFGAKVTVKGACFVHFNTSKSVVFSVRFGVLISMLCDLVVDGNMADFFPQTSQALTEKTN